MSLPCMSYQYEKSLCGLSRMQKSGYPGDWRVSPHHLLLCEDDIPENDGNFKMNPPLRSAKDKEALIEGLLDGTIDIIATDHAPHGEEEKKRGMETAPLALLGWKRHFHCYITFC